MRNLFKKVIFFLIGFCILSVVAFAQNAPSLGAVYDFNALASVKVVSQGGSVVNANVGTSDGPIEGFPPGEIRREKHEQSTYAKLAIADAIIAQTLLASQTPSVTLDDGSLGGRTITPGVYRINGNGNIDGKLTFNGQGQENPVFIIQISGKLQIQRAEYEMLNGAGSINIHWVVEDEVIVSRGTSAIGNIFSRSNITLNDGAQLQGRLIAPQGEIRLTNSVLNLPADLEVRLSKTPGSKGMNTYNFGENITYTIKIRNNGPVNENGVVVAGIQYTGELLGYTSSIQNTSFNGNTWTVGTLNYKQEATLTVTARIDMAGSGYLRALVYGYGIDEVRSNNNADLSFCVLLSETGEITGQNEVCVNESYVYSIAPVEGATRFTWSVPSGWSYTMLSPTSIQVTAKTNAGFIKVTASNTCGEGPARAFEVTPLDGPPAKPGPITGSDILCSSGAELTYSILPVENASSYNWEVPADWTFTGQGTTQIKVKTTSNGGQVSVQAVNPCGSGPAQTLDVQRHDDVPAAPDAILGTSQGCAGGTVSYEVAPVAGAGLNGYNWKVPTGWTIITGNGTNRISVRVGSSAGNISVQVQNTCGASPMITLPVAPVTTAPIAVGPITGQRNTCATSTGLVYSVAPVPTALNYDWQLPAGWVITAGQGTHQITVNTSSNGGEVSVVAVNDCGTSAGSTITVQSTQNVPATPGPITGAQYGCANSRNSTYSIAVVSGATSYVWEVPGGWTITDGQGSTSIQVITGTAAGQVTVTAINACGKGSTRAIEVAPQAMPATPQLTAGPQAPCIGIATTYSVLATAGSSYVWEVPAGWTILSGQGTASILVNATAATGKVKVTARNNCGDSNTTEMAVTPAEGVPATPGAVEGPVNVCIGRSVVYSVASLSSSTSYLWSAPSGWTIVSGQGTGEITVIAGNGAGTVSVAATSSCGDSNSASLQVNAIPVATPTTIFDRSTPCVGLVYEVEVEPVAGALTYTWEVPVGWTITSGQGTPRITVAPGESTGYVSVVVNNGSCNSEPLSLLPDKELARNDVSFPNVFSPNNDGNNDTWVIHNLQNYPQNELVILNRWGNEVYKAKSYKNNWDGDNLSEGTYFYVARLKICDGGEKTFKGFVTIVR